MKNRVLKHDKYTRYKIKHSFKYNPRTKIRKPKGGLVYIYTYPDRPTLKTKLLNYEFYKEKENTEFNGASTDYILSLKSKPTVYRVNLNTQNSLINATNIVNIGPPSKLSKVQNDRANIVLRRFLKAQNYKIRIKNKDSYWSNLQRICYPCVASLPDYDLIFGYHCEYSKYLRRKSLREAIQEIVGHKSKKAFKLTCEALQKHGIRYLWGLLCQRKLLSIDDVQNYLKIHLNCELVSGVSRIKAVDSRRFLRKIKYHYRRKILLDSLVDLSVPSVFSYSYADTIQMWKDYNLEIPDRIQSLSWLHDEFSVQINKKKTRDFQIKWENSLEKYKDIDKKKIDSEIEIRLPKSHHELLDWGSHQKNCVGSYANHIRDEKCAILGIFKNNELTYCLQINKGQTLGQFYGKCNTKPTKNDWEKIIRFLSQNNYLYGYEEYSVNEMDEPF